MVNSTISGSPLQAVPNLLRSMKRWLIHRNKKPVNANWADSTSWLTFDAALARLNQGTGLGFLTTGGVTVDGHTLLVFDLDACRDPLTGTVEPWAMQVVENCGRGYTEITPSGKGLRVFVLVQSPPGFWAPKTFRRGLTRAPNTEGKRLECQVFGTDDKCGHVTITGDRLDNTSEEVARIANLDWWEGVFGQAPDSGVGADGALLELPEGYGPEPSMTEVKAHVSRDQRLKTVVVDGDWKALYSDPTEHSSSDAYMVVVREVLKAANGHGKAAVKFLLTETAWGMERVDSQNREKYGRRDHVEGEVKRIAGKAPVFVFQPLPDDPTTTTGAETPAEKIEKKVRYRIRLFEEVATDPPVQWLVDDLLPRGGLVVLAGGPGAAKSLLILDAAARMARGQTWLGKAVKAASTLYLVGEGGGGMGARIRAWMAKHGGQEKAGGEYVALLDGIPNLAVDTAVLTLLEIMEQCKADYGKMPEVVVVDTLAMAAPGAEENETKDMGLLLKVLAEVRLRTGCTFVVLHHLKKLPPGTPSASVTMDALRGSSAVAGAADVILLALKEGPVERSLRTAKSRDGEEGKPIAYRVWKTVTGGRKDDGSMETAPTVVMEERAPEAGEPPAEVKEAEDDARIITALTEMGSSTSIDRVVRAARLKLSVGRDSFARLLGRRVILETRKLRKSIYEINGVGGCVSPTPPCPRDVGTSAKWVPSQDVQGRFGTLEDVEGMLD